ncbi:S26 family signal peptidase [Paenibacillus sp. TY11]|uniref:S26 family signal peptidase n=1 Tax=Paenibacillus sp. TY11 TaxID=3448633 RepID=UPI004039CDF2
MCHFRSHHLVIDKKHFYKENDFHRGDIIVFQKNDVQFVKRVIGLRCCTGGYDFCIAETVG